MSRIGSEGLITHSANYKFEEYDKIKSLSFYGNPLLSDKYAYSRHAHQELRDWMPNDRYRIIRLLDVVKLSL